MHVAEIVRYPVKSLRGSSVPAVAVEPWGVAGDRRWVVVDDRNTFQTIRQLPVMTQVDTALGPDGLRLSHPAAGTVLVEEPTPGTPCEPVTVWRDTVEAVSAGPEAATFLTAVLGRPMRLMFMADPLARPVSSPFGRPGDQVSFADGFPLLLATEASLDDLNGRLPMPLTMRRFRPNLVVAGTAPWAEDCWRAIRVGSVRFRIAKPCDRCVVVTRDPDTGAQADPREPLRTLASFHRAASGGIVFGQNLVPLDDGTIAVGDPVEVLEEGPSNLL